MVSMKVKAESELKSDVMTTTTDVNSPDDVNNETRRTNDHRSTELPIAASDEAEHFDRHCVPVLNDADLEDQLSASQHVPFSTSSVKDLTVSQTYDILDVSYCRQDLSAQLFGVDNPMFHGASQQQHQRVVPRMGTRVFVSGSRSLAPSKGFLRRDMECRSVDVDQSICSASLSSLGGTDDSFSTDSCDSERSNAADADANKHRQFYVNDEQCAISVVDKFMSAATRNSQSPPLSSSSKICGSLFELPLPPPPPIHESPPPPPSRALQASANWHRTRATPDDRKCPRTKSGLLAPFETDRQKWRCLNNALRNSGYRVASLSTDDHRLQPSTTMLTNRAHLAHTIMVQQKLFQQQMIAVQQHHMRSDAVAAEEDGLPSDEAVVEHYYEEIADRTTPLPPSVASFSPPVTLNTAIDRYTIDSKQRRHISPSAAFLPAEDSVRQPRVSRVDRTRLDADLGLCDQDISVSQLQQQQIDAVEETEWVVKRRPDGSRHIARRSKKPSSSSGTVQCDVIGGSPQSRGASHDSTSSRRRQSSNEPSRQKAEVETSGSTAAVRQRELRAAILELLPLSEPRPSNVVGNTAANIGDIDRISRSHRALLSVTTM